MQFLFSELCNSFPCFSSFLDYLLRVRSKSDGGEGLRACRLFFCSASTIRLSLAGGRWKCFCSCCFLFPVPEKNASTVFLTASSNSSLLISPSNFCGIGLGFTGAFLVVFASGADGLFVCSRLPWFMGRGGGIGVGDLRGGVGDHLGDGGDAAVSSIPS